MSAASGSMARSVAPGPVADADLGVLAGRTVVVKYGGAAMEDPAALDAWAGAVARIVRAGARVVVVHGGGPALTRALARLGIESWFVDGHRVTTPEAAEIAEMVLSGSTNRAVAAALSRAGVAAIGLAGGDAGILDVHPYRPRGADLGRVGAVRAVRVGPLARLLDAGFVPVLSSTARGSDGATFNVNADVVAGAVATTLAADVVAFLSDVAGVRDAGGALLGTVTPGEADALVAGGVADGGMRPKLEAAARSVRAGVDRAVLADGRDPATWLAALAGPDGRVPCTVVKAPARGAATVAP